MPDLENLADVDEDTKALMDAHARLVQSLQPSADNDWSLAQPSPFRFVPSVITDSTSNTSE